MKSQTFGIEIETVLSYNLSRNAYRHAAAAVQSVVGGIVEGPVAGHFVSKASVIDDLGRVWDICSDTSLQGGTAVEFVSPVLRSDDLDELQNVVRAIRAAGFKVNSTCGIHVHVGTKDLDGVEMSGKALKVLGKMMKAKEGIIKKATKRLGSRWCRDLETDLIERLAKAKDNKNEIARAWYGVTDYRYRASNHYDDSRYHALNLHSVFYRETVEFRMFEATLHAGRVKAYVQFCLALTAKARTARSATSRTSRTHNNDKYTLRVFMNHLGLKGDEFKTCRFHLLKNLEGSASYRTREQQDAGHDRERTATVAA